MTEFQQNIINIDAQACQVTAGETNILLSCTVKPDPSDYKLKIEATDVRENF